MRAFTSLATLALLAIVTAIPITPAAPELQRRAEEMRSLGMAEHDIAEQLTLPPFTDPEENPQPLLTQLSSKFYTLLFKPSAEQDTERDLSGDIAPGTLESPQMLPRAAAPESLAETLSVRFGAVFGGRSGASADELERRGFGYEGKESEMRRPQGMRHWG